MSERIMKKNRQFWNNLSNMKRLSLLILMISFIPAAGFSQKTSGKLIFQQGQNFVITIGLKSTISQEAGGNAIDFNVSGSAIHSYKVTNATEDNITFHHEIKQISFNFEGMGQKRSFDSDNKKDLDGFFGAPIKDILSKSYDMIIDPAGKVLMVKPEKIELAKTDDRLAIVLNMLRDVTSVVYPPKKNEASFFKVLPDTATGLNGSWAESGEDANSKFRTVYTLSAVTDSTIIVDVKGSSTTNVKAEMMGTQTSTNMNNAYTGQIVLDKTSGIIRERTINTVSNGTTEAMGGTMPVTSKTTITIHVKPD
jgi:hypothetical protein